MHLVRSDKSEFSGPLAQPLYKVAKSNSWLSVGRGVYLDYGGEAGNKPKFERMYAARILAAAHRAPGAIMSHYSAAVLHGLPLFAHRIPDLVHVTRASSGKANKSTVTHRGKLGDDEIVEKSGVKCTSLERTVQDLARVLPPHELLAVADAALARGADLTSLASRPRNRTLLQWVAKHANGRAESLGESWSRFKILEAGFLLPGLQADVLDEQSAFVARTDFITPEGLIGEFDGKLKYDELLDEKDTPSKAVMREKERESRLEDLGFVVVRWGWDLLENHPDTFLSRWRSGLLRAASLPAPRGQVRYPERQTLEAPKWDSTFTWKLV